MLEMPLYREIAHCIEKEAGKAGSVVLQWLGVRWNKNPKGNGKSARLREQNPRLSLSQG